MNRYKKMKEKVKENGIVNENDKKNEKVKNIKQSNAGQCNACWVTACGFVDFCAPKRTCN